MTLNVKRRVYTLFGDPRERRCSYTLIVISTHSLMIPLHILPFAGQTWKIGLCAVFAPINTLFGCRRHYGCMDILICFKQTLNKVRVRITYFLFGGEGAWVELSTLKKVGID